MTDKKRREWWISVYKKKHVIATMETKPHIIPDPQYDEFVHVTELRPGDRVISRAELRAAWDKAELKPYDHSVRCHEIEEILFGESDV